MDTSEFCTQETNRRKVSKWQGLNKKRAFFWLTRGFLQIRVCLQCPHPKTRHQTATSAGPTRHIALSQSGFRSACPHHASSSTSHTCWHRWMETHAWGQSGHSQPWRQPRSSQLHKFNFCPIIHHLFHEAFLDFSGNGKEFLAPEPSYSSILTFKCPYHPSQSCSYSTTCLREWHQHRSLPTSV